MEFTGRRSCTSLLHLAPQEALDLIDHLLCPIPRLHPPPPAPDAGGKPPGVHGTAYQAVCVPLASGIQLGGAGQDLCPALKGHLGDEVCVGWPPCSEVIVAPGSSQAVVLCSAALRQSSIAVSPFFVDQRVGKWTKIGGCGAEGDRQRALFKREGQC